MTYEGHEDYGFDQNPGRQLETAIHGIENRVGLLGDHYSPQDVVNYFEEEFAPAKQSVEQIMVDLEAQEELDPSAEEALGYLESVHREAVMAETRTKREAVNNGAYSVFAAFNDNSSKARFAAELVDGALGDDYSFNGSTAQGLNNTHRDLF